MSREIALKCWDIGKKCWIPSMYWYLDPIGIPRWQSDDEEIFHVEIVQFTGLKDKNGKEIYEGDIVRWAMTDESRYHERSYTEQMKNPYSFHIRIIEYWNDRFIGKDPTQKYCDLGAGEISVLCEVIGNIYENPSMVK